MLLVKLTNELNKEYSGCNWQAGIVLLERGLSDPCDKS